MDVLTQHEDFNNNPIFRLRNAKKSLESNLNHLDQTVNLYQCEENFTRTRPRVQRVREPTPIEEGHPVYSPGVRRPLSDLLQPLDENPFSKISREPWWWRYPSLRPHIEELKALPSYLRGSYLSPVKSTFRWYEHPFRPYGPVTQSFYYYLWRRTHLENRLDEIDGRIREAINPPAHLVYP
ncbi:uncharacterized protein LOC110835160 [Zootermopsis nevadensis]|uniref:uncharacterized protein LOC110835160 n=1 Tax=Zootermopsis nevadensis TaxID=136037 RepID=UPI000B8EC13F|nr:uncharacterized protein LOC110835160 [Zootermopsis nevadensis]